MTRWRKQENRAAGTPRRLLRTGGWNSGKGIGEEEFVVPALPYLLSFAFGAMIYVVAEELNPEMSEGKHSNIGTVLFAVGFTLMMAPDVALG